MLVELPDGNFCDPEQVGVVKKISDDECTFFMTGQSAVDGGFKIDYPALDFAQHINDAIEKMYGGDDDKEDDKEDS